MTLLHVSDTHGLFVPLDSTATVVIHTGDFFPNVSRGIAAVERGFQATWMNSRMRDFQRWIGTRRFLYVPGNHDYFDPVPMMQERGVNAWNLHTGGPERIGKHRVFGFPWVPRFTGEWNYECNGLEMHDRLEPLRRALEAGEVDILACHTPIYGVLDRVGDDRTGSMHLRGALETCTNPPRYVLHGHIHCATGIMHWKRGIVVSNAATMQRRIKLEEDT